MNKFAQWSGRILPSCASLHSISKAEHDKLLLPCKAHPCYKMQVLWAARDIGKLSQNLHTLAEGTPTSNKEDINRKKEDSLGISILEISISL